MRPPLSPLCLATSTSDDTVELPSRMQGEMPEERLCPPVRRQLNHQVVNLTGFRGVLSRRAIVERTPNHCTFLVPRRARI